MVGGHAQFAGDLIVSLQSFVPDRLDSFTVLTAGTLSGSFDNVLDGARLDTLGGEGSFLVSYDSVSNNVVLSDFLGPGLPGDFDMDGDVDGQDFLVWQRNPSVGDLTDFLGPGLPGDFDMDGDVDGQDFLEWQRNPSVGNLTDWQTDYGMSTPPLSASSSVPEPSAWLLALSAVLLQCSRRHRCS